MKRILPAVLILPLVLTDSEHFRKFDPEHKHHPGPGHTETGWPTFNDHPLGVGPVLKQDIDSEGHKYYHLYGDEPNKPSSGQASLRLTAAKKTGLGQTETGWPTINGVPLGVGPVKLDGSKTGGNVYGKTETGWPTINGKPLGVGPVMKPVIDSEGHKTLHLYGEELNSEESNLRQTEAKPEGLGQTETGWPTINGVPLGVGPVMKPVIDSEGHKTLHLYGEEDLPNSEEANLRLAATKPEGLGQTETGWPTINGIPLGPGPIIPGRIKKDDSKTGGNVFGRTETGWPTINGKPLGVGPAMKWAMDGKGHVHLHLYDDEDVKNGSGEKKDGGENPGN